AFTFNGALGYHQFAARNWKILTNIFSTSSSTSRLSFINKAFCCFSFKVEALKIFIIKYCSWFFLNSWLQIVKGLLTEERKTIDPDARPYAKSLKEVSRYGLQEGASLIEVCVSASIRRSHRRHCSSSHARGSSPVTVHRTARRSMWTQSSPDAVEVPASSSASPEIIAAAATSDVVPLSRRRPASAVVSLPPSCFRHHPIGEKSSEENQLALIFWEDLLVEQSTAGFVCVSSISQRNFRIFGAVDEQESILEQPRVFRRVLPQFRQPACNPASIQGRRLINSCR
ncbi:NAD-dependent malic enzyme isoform, partial [Nymphaea thermarum]